MASIKPAMESAFNEFVQGHKVNPSTKLTLVQFDSLNPYDLVYQSVPVGAVEPLKLDPRGGTPLIDAFVQTIDRTGERLASLRESERPDQVLMVIITDGEENASRNHKRSDVSMRVANQHSKYGWNFLYLGANQDAIREASSYGIGREFAMSYNATAGGTISASNSFTANSVNYASSVGGERLKSRSLNFTDDQRKQAVEDIIETTTTTKS